MCYGGARNHFLIKMMSTTLRFILAGESSTLCRVAFRRESKSEERRVRKRRKKKRRTSNCSVKITINSLVLEEVDDNSSRFNSPLGRRRSSSKRENKVTLTWCKINETTTQWHFRFSHFRTFSDIRIEFLSSFLHVFTNSLNRLCALPSF